MRLVSDDIDILRHEISEDGVHWRPYDPKVDPDCGVHRRIEFAPPIEDTPQIALAM